MVKSRVHVQKEQLGALLWFTQTSQDSLCLSILIPICSFGLVQRCIFDVRALVFLDHREAFENPFLFLRTQFKFL